MNEPKSIVLPWYACEEDFLAVIRMLPAEERNGAVSYQEFSAWIDAEEDAFYQSGVSTWRVTVKASALKTWCNANHLPVCNSSIERYARETADRHERRILEGN